MTLLIQFNIEARRAVFSGNTFAHKEEIKALGAARWNGAEKQWVVEGLSLREQQLQEMFPDSQVLVKGEASEQVPVSEELEQAGVPEGVSVSEFLTRVRSAIQSAFPAPILIHGLISKVKSDPIKKRVFVELIDAEQRNRQVSCVVWQGADRIFKPLFDAGFQLEKDLQIMLKVVVGLNQTRGDLSLQIVGVVAEYTIAKLAAIREVTNKRLKEEKLFDLNREKKIPLLPVRLGILTSNVGTVIHDFKASLDEAEFGFQLFWRSVRVQGDGAEKDIVAAIREFGTRKDLDAILLFRGGGSQQDLAVFNQYKVAKAICLCPLPVVTAIGHQEDQCSAQDVSALALGVPKDVGRYFADRIIDLRKGLVELATTIRHVGERSWAEASADVRRITSSIPRFVSLQIKAAEQRSLSLLQAIGHLAETLVNERHTALRYLASSATERASSLVSSSKKSVLSTATLLARRLEGSLANAEFRLRGLAKIPSLLKHRLELTEQRLDSLQQLMSHLHPREQLKRGFALIRKQGSDKIITRASQLSSRESLEVEFFDETIQVEKQ